VAPPPPHHNRFTALFPGPPGWAGARSELLDFIVQEKINRGRHTDHPAGRHSIQTNQRPPPPSLIVAHTRQFTSHFPSDPSWAVDSEQWLTQTYVVNHWCSVLLSHWLTVGSVLPLWHLYTASTQCWWWYISSLQRWYPVLVMMMPLLCIEYEPESPGRGLRSSPPACTVSLSEVQKARDLDLDLG